MANKKISELTDASSLTGSEELPILQSGATVKVALTDVWAKGASPLIAATWVDLSAVTPAGGEGSSAQVPTTDTGTHTDPVVGGTVNNTGVYRYSASPAGWERIADTDAMSAKPYADAAAASASDAAANAAVAMENQQYGTARERYLRGLADAGVSKPKAAVIILLGQSLAAPRGTTVQAKSAPIAKMPVGGCSIVSWPFYSFNRSTVGEWSNIASAVVFTEDTAKGQSPMPGIIGMMAGTKFPRLYVGNGAVPAYPIQQLMQYGPQTNAWALVWRLCELARADGYDPQVMFYSAHGEANAATNLTFGADTKLDENGYYALAMQFYRRMQYYAATCMLKPGYIAPVALTYPAQNTGNAGTTDRDIKEAIRRVCIDLPGAIDCGPIYQWPMTTDKVHPTDAAYVQRGEAVGKALREWWDKNTMRQVLQITDVALSGSTFVARFTHPVMRDDTLGVGSALAGTDGLEWLDNGAAIAITSLTYSGHNINGTLASAPVGTIDQQVLRIAEQSTGSAAAAYPANDAGCYVRASDVDGWPSIYDPSYFNYLWAAPQSFTSVRTA